MGPKDGSGSTYTVDFGVGQVGGAESNLYSGSNGDISVTYSAPVAGVVGGAGGFDHPNFNPTDFTIAGAIGSVLGVGLSAELSHPTTGGLNLTLGASVVAGGTITVSAPSWNPTTWGVTTNGDISLDTRVNVGLLGMGLGGGIQAGYDEGRFGIGGNLDLGIVGLTASANTDQRHNVVVGDQVHTIVTEGTIVSSPNNNIDSTHENADGSVTISATDVNTGAVSSTTFVQGSSGSFVPMTSTTGGNVYAAGNVGVGQELNGLEQSAHENHIRGSISSATPPAPSSNGGTERRSSDGGNKGDGGGTKTGGNGTSKKHSVPSDTGYASKGVNNLEGLEAAGAGPISLYHRHGSGPDCRSWNT